MNRCVVVGTALAVVLLLAAGSGDLDAQGRALSGADELIRRAAVLESNGDLDGAETSLRELLGYQPSHAGALFALDRVLRNKGESDEILPLIEGYLAYRDDSDVEALRLRILAEERSPTAMVERAEEWLDEARNDEVAYVEVARAYGVSLGTEQALDVLRRGRRVLGDDALALDMGDYLAQQGDTVGAADEWAKAVGPTGAGMGTVRRRIESLPDGGIGVGRRLVLTLAESNSAARRQVGTLIAVELGLQPEAQELVLLHSDDLGGVRRRSYLEAVARAAERSGLSELEAWAEGELRDAGVARVAPSEERRLADIRDLRLDVASAPPDRIATGWETFRSDFPDAPELDELGATVARALLVQGDRAGAADALLGVEGPLSDVERAYIRLAEGDVEAGREALLATVGGMPPAEATRVIQLASLLGRLSEDAAAALAEGAVQTHLGRGGEAALRLGIEVDGLDPAEQSLLLAEGARMADRAGDGAMAAELRRRIVDEHPEAPEAGEATLSLARYLVSRRGDVSGAIRILEDMIIRQPNAAVVPDARLELERLRSRAR